MNSEQSLGITIHPTAVVSSKAILGKGTVIGPFAIVEENTKLGTSCTIGARSHIVAGTTLGDDVRVYDSAVVGSDPQDLKYGGEKSFLSVGSGSVIREFTTLNRGTGEGGITRLGENCLVMAYAHIAHDCVLEDYAVVANGVQLGGHVFIGKHSVVGGGTMIHQFSKIGSYCYIGGTLKIDRDIPPFVKAFGNPLRFAGLNTVGLQKSEWAGESIDLKRSFRELYNSNVSMSEVINSWKLKSKLVGSQQYLLEFLEQEHKNSLLSGQGRK
jgi:UDP-N-acetylglucosamine acyltransferase